MIREVIKPKTNNITIQIPDSYIDREVEFIVFPLKDDKVRKNKKQNITKNLFGSLKSKKLDEKSYKTYLEDKYL